MNERLISAIVVLYQPDLQLLRGVITSISSQCDKVIAVDNSDGDNERAFEREFSELGNVTYLPLKSNFGIAYAQNRGIELAKAEGYQYVIFFDQDSTPSTGMVAILIEEIQHLQLSNEMVATLGPLPLNSQTSEIYAPRVFKYKTKVVKDKSFFEVKQIISSGSVIPINIFEKVGTFDEKLFIDGVDHEWCWRAKTYGYKTFMSNSTKLVHKLGEGDKKLFGLSIATTSPSRLYYQYRNYIDLFFRGYVPIYWKVNNLIKYSVKMLYYPIMYKDLSVLNRMCRGIRDGVLLTIKR